MFVTVRFAAMRFAKFATPPKIAFVRTVNVSVEVSDRTINEFRFEIEETFRDPRVSDPTFRVVMLAKGVTNEFRFEIEETFRDPMYPWAVFKVETFARGVTNEFRFEIEETLRDVRYRYGILTVSKLNTMFDVFAENAGVEMFDETFRVVTLAKGVTNEFRFEIAETFRPSDI